MKVENAIENHANELFLFPVNEKSPGYLTIVKSKARRPTTVVPEYTLVPFDTRFDDVMFTTKSPST